MSGWDFASIVSSIKETSNSALETISSDLKEFTTTVSADVNEVAENVKQNVLKKEAGANSDAPGNTSSTSDSPSTASFSSTFFTFGSQILSGAEEFLVGPAGSEASSQRSIEQTPSEPGVPVSQHALRLQALQENPVTYTTAPPNKEAFERWCDAVDAEERKALEHEVIANYPTVLAQFQLLVPKDVSEEQFWLNYLYKSSILCSEDSRRAKILANVQSDDEEEDFDWGDEETETEEKEPSKGIELEKDNTPAEKDIREEVEREVQHLGLDEEATSSKSQRNIVYEGSIDSSSELVAPRSAESSSTKEGEETALKPRSDGSEDSWVGVPPHSHTNEEKIVKVDDESEDDDWGSDEDEKEQEVEISLVEGVYGKGKESNSNKQSPSSEGMEKKTESEEDQDWGEWD